MSVKSAAMASTSTSLPTTIIAMAWSSYVRKLQTDPVLTKSVTAAVLSVCSEIFAKKMTKLPLQTSAAIHELTIGLVLRGPVIHAFHTFLDRVLFKRMKQTSAFVVIAKLVIDQFVFTPIFTSAYFYFRALAEDKSLPETTVQIRKDLAGIMRKNWTVWIPANFVNYLFVPLDQRVLFGSVVAFFWNAYLISRVATSAGNAATR